MSGAGSVSYPRILHVLAPGPAGGLESVVRALARGWRRAGGDVGIALVVPAGSPAPAGIAQEKGLEIFPIEIAGRAYLEERRRLLELFHRWRPDIVHTHGYRPDLIAGSAARSIPVPWVTTFHGFTGGDWKNRLYEFLQVRAARKASAVIAVSRPLLDRLTGRGVSSSRIALILNAIDRTGTPLTRLEARAALGLEGSDPVLGWVGRLTREKGADVALAALPEVGQVRLSVVGEGPEQAALRAAAETAGVASRVRWHGLVPEAHRIFSAFDCFVLSSRTEGTPIALLEAMAAGVPVVATAVGGVPDVLGAGEGLLVPAEDPGALAQAVKQVLDDPAASRARARLAQERIDRDFAVEPWIERHRVLYQRLLTS